MSTSHLEKSYAAALNEVATKLKGGLREYAEAIPMPPAFAMLLTPSAADAKKLAEESLLGAIKQALEVPAYPLFTCTFSPEWAKIYPRDTAQKAIIQGANGALRKLQREQIVVCLMKAGVKADTANHLATPIITAPQEVREYARISS